MYIKIDPNDTETDWNASFHKICMSGAPPAPLKGVLGPLGGPTNNDFIKYDGI